MMTSEKTLRLCRGELIRLDGDVAGRVVSCSEGVLWLTQTDTPGDHLVRAGESFSIGRPGVVLISALEDSVYALSGQKSKLFAAAGSFMPVFRRLARRFETARGGILA